jgi:hypothetical protein
LVGMGLALLGVCGARLPVGTGPTGSAAGAGSVPTTSSSADSLQAVTAGALIGVAVTPEALVAVDPSPGEDR